MSTSKCNDEGIDEFREYLALETDTSGWRLDTAQSCGFSQGNARWPAAADGPLGDYLVVYRDAPFVPSAAIYGRFWGIRVFLPATLRNAH